MIGGDRKKSPLAEEAGAEICRKCLERIRDRNLGKQGRIHGNPVADGWAGAVMRKPLEIQKCDGRTYRPTDLATRQVVESRVRD